MTRKHITPLFFLLSALALSGITLQVQAVEEVRYYDFEIIVFASLDSEARASENWKKDLSREIPQRFIELDELYPGVIPKEYNPKFTFKTLPAQNMQLLEDAKLLEQSGQYHVLLHTAWRQPGMAEEIALPIHFHKSFIENRTIEQTTVVKQDPDMPAVNLPAPRQYSPAATEQTQTSLDGYIRLILSRYLHADVNLVYSTGVPVNPAPVAGTTIVTENTVAPNGATQPTPVFYQLKEIRKMRSKEVHYLDHPVLGMLILATPVEETR